MPCGSATLSTFDPNIGDSMVLLSKENVQVQLEDRPFAKGGCREAFICRIADAGTGFAFGKKLVAKRYMRKDEFLEDYICAHTAQSYAKKFNEKNPFKKIRFLVPNRIMTFNGVRYSLEEFLEGRWQKHNNIFGMMESNHTTPSAFSHFTYQASGQKLMILDVQGVGDTYTDPAIVSTCQGKYGYTDTGMTGISGFLRNHSCSQVCSAVLHGAANCCGSLPIPSPAGAAAAAAAPHHPHGRRRSADLGGSRPTAPVFPRPTTPGLPLPLSMFSPAAPLPPPLHGLSNRPSNLLLPSTSHGTSTPFGGVGLGGFSSGAFLKSGGVSPPLSLGERSTGGGLALKQLSNHALGLGAANRGISTAPNFGMLISV